MRLGCKNAHGKVDWKIDRIGKMLRNATYKGYIGYNKSHRLPYLYPYIEEYVDKIVTVAEENIMKAIKIGCLYGKLTMEGAAALPLAAILEGKCARTDNTVLICSGGNIDQTLFEKCLAVEL